MSSLSFILLPVVLLTAAEVSRENRVRVATTVSAERQDTVITVIDRIPKPELGKDAVLSGWLVDAGSGKPIAGAVVRVGRRTKQADGIGDFRLDEISAGSQAITVEHVAYGKWSGVLALEAGTETVIRVALTPRAIELDGIDVESQRDGRALSPRASSSSRRVIAGEDLAKAQRRGSRIADIIRSRFPVQVREATTNAGISTGICVESNRRIARLTPGPDCEMLPIILDGISIGKSPQFLRNIQVSDLESIEFVSSLDAAILYGMEAGAAGGALVLWTRGRGPYASERRNPR